MDRHQFEKAELIAIRKLDKIRSGDNESDHGDADFALLEFVTKVSPDVAAAFTRCYEATKPWWFA